MGRIFLDLGLGGFHYQMLLQLVSNVLQPHLLFLTAVSRDYLQQVAREGPWAHETSSMSVAGTFI
jgi:hypothetical protein